MDSICDAGPGRSYPDILAVGGPVAEPDLPPAQSGLDLSRVLRRLVRGLPIILACLCLGLWAGVAALRALPAQYASTAAMLIDPKRPGSLGADAAFANLVVDSAKVASVELVLTSSGLLGRVVDQARLADDTAFGAARSSQLRRWLTRMAPDLFRPQAETAQARRSRAVYRLGRSIRTARVGMTYVVNVTVTADSAAQAQSLAGSVVDAYLSDQIDTKVAAARRDVAWLAEQVAQLQRKLSGSETAVEDIRRRYGIVETDRGAGATLDRQAATDINTQLQQAEGLVATSRARYEQARRVLEAHGDLDALPEVSGSPHFLSLRAQQAEAEHQLATLRALYTEAYPEVAHARANARVLGLEVAAEARRVVAELGHGVESSVTLRDSLRQRLGALVSATSDDDQAHGRIRMRQAERTLQTDQLAYTAALTRLHELQQQPARQEAEMRVISSPDLPDAPSFPKPALFLGAGGALGLLAGLGAVLLLPVLRKRVEDAAAASLLLALPLLAAVPRLSRADLRHRGAAPDYLAGNPVSPYADSLRLMRLALRSKSGMPQVVQFTSSAHGEGKSTLSASLAVSAASAGIRTVVVDLDFYRPSVCRIFALPEGPGVGDVLAGADYAQLPRLSHADLPLRVIGTGTGHRLLGDDLDRPAFRSLMAALRDEYELVVLDTPPVLAVADALLIARHADATIMVCAWRVTPQKAAAQAVQALRSARVRLAGLVVNKVARGNAQTYPGGYYDRGQLRTALAAHPVASLGRPSDAG